MKQIAFLIIIIFNSFVLAGQNELSFPTLSDHAQKFQLEFAYLENGFPIITDVDSIIELRTSIGRIVRNTNSQRTECLPSSTGTCTITLVFVKNNQRDSVMRSIEIINKPQIEVKYDKDLLKKGILKVVIVDRNTGKDISNELTTGFSKLVLERKDDSNLTEIMFDIHSEINLEILFNRPFQESDILILELVLFGKETELFVERIKISIPEVVLFDK